MQSKLATPFVSCLVTVKRLEAEEAQKPYADTMHMYESVSAACDARFCFAVLL